MTEHRVPALHVATMIVTPIVASLPWVRLDVSESIRYPACAVSIVLGVALMAWTFAHLRGGMRARISPVLPARVTTGPFRFLRHPFYFGIALVLLGTVVKVMSLLGFGVWLFVYLPVTVWRMRLEDRALEAKFGASA